MISKPKKFIKLIFNKSIKLFIDMMTTNKNASKGAKYLKLWKLNVKDFPQLNERLEKNCIRYIVRSEDWKKAEFLTLFFIFSKEKD